MNHKVPITSHKFPALSEMLAGSKLFLSSTFARNWSFLAVSGLLAQFLGMVASFRIARLLAPQGFGLYNLVLATAGLGAVLTGLGFRNVIIRETARHPDQSGQIFLISAVLRLVMFLVIGLAVLLFSLSGLSELNLTFSAAAAAVLLALAAWDLAESIAFGHEKMEFTALINFLGAVFWAAAAWLVPSAWLTPLSVSLAYALLQLVESLVYLRICFRQKYFGFATGWPTWTSRARSLLFQSLPFYWLVLLTAGTTQLPILFLAWRSGPAEVGVFGIGLRLTLPLSLVISYAPSALYPALSKAYGEGDAGQFTRTVNRTLLAMAAAGTLGALGITLLRSEVVVFFFGVGYANAAGALAFLCWHTVLQGIYSLVGTSLAASDNQKWLAILSAAFATLAIPILWIGARYGASGLAGAMLAGGVINFGYHLWVLQKKLPRPLSLSSLAGCLAILAAGVGLSFTIPQAWDWPLRAFLSLCLIFVLSGLMAYRILLKRPFGNLKSGRTVLE